MIFTAQNINAARQQLQQLPHSRRKNVLIDTVDHKFSREFVQNLRNEIDLADIDYIVINHAEEDHAGALTELMAQIPDTPIYCTANAIDSINGHHHHPEWNLMW